MAKNKTSRRRHTYTLEDVNYIRDNYAMMSSREIAAHIGCSHTAVSQIAHRMGLYKSKKWIADRARERTMEPNHGSRHYRYQPGHIPAQKGIPQREWMTPEGIVASTRTRFTPGHRPANYRPVGSERVNVFGYREIKVEDNRFGWRPLHRVVWEREHGAVPPGHRIAFRDGNKLNCELSNLELITAAEMARRNNIHNYPEGFRELVRMRGRLTREINKQKRQNNGNEM